MTECMGAQGYQKFQYISAFFGGQFQTGLAAFDISVCSYAAIQFPYDWQKV